MREEKEMMGFGGKKREYQHAGRPADGDLLGVCEKAEDRWGGGRITKSLGDSVVPGGLELQLEPAALRLERRNVLLRIGMRQLHAHVQLNTQAVGLLQGFQLCLLLMLLLSSLVQLRL